jgi:hypothetical protein
MGCNAFHLGKMPKHDKNDIELLRTWTLSAAATLGSSVRAKGILQEIQARLPAASKKSLSLEGRDLALAMSTSEKAAFNAAVVIVAKAMAETEVLAVIPREIEDILNIKTSERHRWLADGRLPSAGTRTVRLNGRARQITFHVFDPRVVEDLLDRGAVDQWREEDAEAKVEKRREVAHRAKLTRSLNRKGELSGKTDSNVDDTTTELRGWEEFNRDGFLR